MTCRSCSGSVRMGSALSSWQRSVPCFLALSLVTRSYWRSHESPTTPTRDLERKQQRWSPRSEEHTSESSHLVISYAVFCLKKKKMKQSNQSNAYDHTQTVTAGTP